MKREVAREEDRINQEFLYPAVKETQKQIEDLQAQMKRKTESGPPNKQPAQKSKEKLRIPMKEQPERQESFDTKQIWRTKKCSRKRKPKTLTPLHAFNIAIGGK